MSSEEPEEGAPPAAAADARDATARLLWLGAWGFFVSGGLSLAAQLWPGEEAWYLGAAGLIAWIPGVRALLFLGEALRSGGLAPGAIGLFWAAVLLEMLKQPLDGLDHDRQVWVTMLGWLGFVGLLCYVLRPRASGESAHSRTKVFAGVGIGLLLLGKLLAKTKLWHFFGLSRLTRLLTGSLDPEAMELLLMLAIGLLAAGCNWALGISLIRRRAVHVMFGIVGWFTLISFIVSFAEAVLRSEDDPEPVVHTLSALVGLAYHVLMGVMLLAFRRQGLSRNEHAALIE